MTRVLRSATLAVVAWMVAGCSRCDSDTKPPATRRDASAPAASTDPDAAYTWYRVEANIGAHGRVPFVIGVHRERPEGVIVSSAEERLPLIVLSRAPLALRIPVRGIELRFRTNGFFLSSYWTTASRSARTPLRVASTISAFAL